MYPNKHQLRRERSARILADEKRRTQRIRTLAGSGILAGAVALGGGVWALADTLQQESRSHFVQGVASWSGLSRNHTKKPVSYPMSPPVGGDHSPIWLKCEGTVYVREVRNESAVHSLEHGAVWVTYTEEASKTDIKALKKKVTSTGYTLMSPYRNQEAPIILSAWGHQLKVRAADDPRVDRFLKKYVEGSQTPEPNASCSGGYMRSAPTGTDHPKG